MTCRRAVATIGQHQSLPTGGSVCRVIDVKIVRREPLAQGEGFGEIGGYERIDGVLTYAVDPNNPANESIVDLQYAPVDDAGQVRFESDFTLVTPMDSKPGQRPFDRGGGEPGTKADGNVFSTGGRRLPSSPTRSRWATVFC